MMKKNFNSCKNCGNQFEGKFCNICGQSAGVARITWKEVYHYIPHALFHLDSGFFFTIKQLATRPGDMIREYLEGKRKNYYNPFLMLILTAGLCSVLYAYFHFQTIFASVRLDRLEEQSELVAHKYFAIRTFFFCLFCSVGDYLIFYNKKFVLPEMIVANVFMFAEITVFQLLFIPVLLLGDYFDINLYLRILFVIVVLGYMFISRYQFYQAKGERGLTAKIALAILAYLVVVSLIGQLLVEPFFRN